MNLHEIFSFSAFIILILSMLIIDLAVFNKDSHVVYFKEALIWSIVWISLSLCFYVVIITHGDLIHGVNSIEDIKQLTIKFEHPIVINPNNFQESFQQQIS